MIIYQFENIGNTYDFKSNHHSDWFVPTHLHEYSEFVFTKKGVFHMTLEGKEFTVPENHLIFVGPNQLHECRSNAPSLVTCIVFSNDFVPFFYSLIKEKSFENPVFDFSDNTNLISELDDTSSDKTLKICGLLNIVLDKMLERSPLIPKDKSTPSAGIFYLIINYISNNFTEDIHLSDVARDLGYNEKYLSSAVRSLTGVNFRTFLAMYRINYAKNLITNNQGSISEIAVKCGFSSINTFNRMFLRITGVTPSVFKREKTHSKKIH